MTKKNPKKNGTNNMSQEVDSNHQITIGVRDDANGVVAEADKITGGTLPASPSPAQQKASEARDKAVEAVNFADDAISKWEEYLNSPAQVRARAHKISVGKAVASLSDAQRLLREASALVDDPRKRVIEEAVDKAKEDLEAIEEIANTIGDDIAVYRAESIRLTGGDPDDDLKTLTSDVDTALASAKTALNEAKNALASGRADEVEGFASDVASARKQAEAARDDLAGKSKALNQQKIVDEARKEAKSDSVVKQWLRPRAAAFGLLGGAALFVGVAVLVGLPSWLPTGVVLSVAFIAILAMAAWVIAQEPPAGRGSAAMAIAVAAAVFSIALFSGGGDSDSDNKAPETETPAPVGVIVTGATFEADVPHPTESPSD